MVKGDIEKSAAEKAARDLALSEMMDPGAGVMVDPDGVQSMFGPTTSNSAPTETQVEVDESVPSSPEEDRDSAGKIVWGPPTYDNQYEKYPGTVRMLGPKVAVFNIIEKNELAELNKLLAQMEPKGAPSIVLMSKKDNAVEGKWLYIVEYYVVEYKKLLTAS